MWDRLKRFRALDSAARGDFLRAAAMMPLVSLSLRLRGFHATQRMLAKSLRLRTTQAGDPERIKRVTRMVHAAVRHAVGHPTCLQESLVLWWLLGRQGIASEVRIGTRKNQEKFEAHAWVECGGIAINEPESNHQHYAAFDAAFSALPPEQR